MNNKKQIYFDNKEGKFEAFLRYGIAGGIEAQLKSKRNDDYLSNKDLTATHSADIAWFNVSQITQKEN